MAPQLLGLLGVGVGTFAAGIEAVLAEKAFTAGNGERHHHPVAHLEFRVVFPDFDNIAHGLMAKNIALFHGRHDAVEQMQIRAADRTGRHLDNRVAPILDLGVRDLFTAYIAFAVPGEGFHGPLLRVAKPDQAS